MRRPRGTTPSSSYSAFPLFLGAPRGFWRTKQRAFVSDDRSIFSVRYYEGAARAAADDFHAAGQQPMHEMNRLSDDVADAAAGQVGDDDEQLQHQV